MFENYNLRFVENENETSIKKNNEFGLKHVLCWSLCTGEKKIVNIRAHGMVVH